MEFREKLLMCPSNESWRERENKNSTTYIFMLVRHCLFGNKSLSLTRSTFNL